MKFTTTNQATPVANIMPAALVKPAPANAAQAIASIEIAMKFGGSRNILSVLSEDVTGTLVDSVGGAANDDCRHRRV